MERRNRPCGRSDRWTCSALLPPRKVGLAYRLIYDYTVGFALCDRATVGEQ
jgi:hypothetical protein